MKEKKFSVYWRIRTLFFMALIPIAGISLIMIQVANTCVRRQGTEKMELQLAARVSSFDNELGRINSGLRFHVVNGEEAFLATNYHFLSSYQLGQKVSELNDRLNELSLISDCIEDISIYMPRIGRTVSLLHYYDDSISEKDMKRISAYHYEDNGNLYDNGKIRVHMVAPTSSGRTPLYVMEAVLSNRKILSFIKGGAEDETYALAGPDWIISGAGPDSLGEAVEKIRNQEEEYGSFIMDDFLFTYHRLVLCDGWMISYAKTDTLLEAARIFNFFTFIMLAVTVVVILIVVFLLSKDINRPFQQLLWLFGKVESGCLDVKTDYHFQDEFVMVFDQFDRMLLRIRMLLAQSVEREKELQKAEYRQLQAHIAPHFLYNSFNVLRHCVLMEDYETASEMTRLLGNYFQYMTYGGEQEAISLLEEYRHAQDYLEIQKIRFQNNITIRINDLPEMYHNFRVPPFVLQPLVENVFKHGIRDLPYTGQISVQVEKRKQELCLIVWDNGFGMDFQKLEELKKALREDKLIPGHSGLININRRLKILLGEMAELDVDSKKGIFFEAVIRIPVEVPIEEKEREND